MALDSPYVTKAQKIKAVRGATAMVKQAVDTYKLSRFQYALDSARFLLTPNTSHRKHDGSILVKPEHRAAASQIIATCEAIVKAKRITGEQANALRAAAVVLRTYK